MTTLRAIKNTKKARAALIFKELTDKGATRQQILDRLMAKLGMTLSCASTYNQNFRSGFWKADAELTTSAPYQPDTPPTPVAKDITKMSLYELQQHWDTHARFAIPKFRTTAEAIDAIRDYCPITN